MQRILIKLAVRLNVYVLLVAMLFGCGQQGSSSTTVSTSQGIAEMNHATGLFNAGRYEEAEAAYKAILDQYPDDAEAWSSYGFVLMELDRLEEAADAFEKSIAIKPDWSDPYLGLGILARKNDELDKAYQYYEKAIEYNPKDGYVLGSMLVINLRRGDFDLAVSHGERATQLLPNDPVVNANLAVAYHYKEMFEKRDAAAQRAEAMGYEDMDAIKQIFAGELTVGPD